MKKWLFSGAAVLVLLGCSTKYEARPNSFIGKLFRQTGYSDQQIDDDMFIVTFVSKAGSSEQANLRRAMYRAAELSLEKHYKYFKVIGTQGLPRIDSSGYHLPVTNLTIKCFGEKPSDDAVISAEKYISLNAPESISDSE